MYDCGSCLHLDKTRKTEIKIAYRYGCNNTKATKGYIPGWIIKTAGEKSELKKMGCGAWVDRKESAE